ncbi:cytochrome-c oxidase, cbb3-type subunit I [Puniceicoccus vermicola]|uniref:cytochrome-c oxidase n=1 Tax=Puniceicoccus vermicola TaxID=388746 RepID=A0A7X1AXX2_9BACT|nr:cytochrome-c oxidase, cbb3-type subunit I [Puniceicoccus vermicola]MBC2602021.1 cytochrome-c oxidase, cbb3-type subunit I [Puniceicoccus vermicola]
MENHSRVTIEYDDRIVRQFTIASIFWGVIGMSAGALIASQLNFWQMNGKFLEWLTFGLIQNEGLQQITFGRLRPLHTNAAIFAFVGNMMFAGVYYSTQRLCRCRLASDLLSKIHFWGWQLIIVGAAISLPIGLTRGKEYAELIWPINICVVLIWVVFAINFFWTLIRRNERSLYVALWFYIATIVTVAMLYIVNHLSIPTSFTHSYPIFAGVQDALVQWWYGHNAVAFFLTTPILGIMYYFIPKAAQRPVYSYRLSVIHFWSLVFIYIWAGPHHLLNTALPSWLQALGMIFSLMLWAPSWGGMLNGLLTLRGAWHRLRTDPVLKFLIAGVTFYGMATFEGPLLAIKSLNSLSHYSDWTIGHVHSGTLGWNGFMAAGMFYWLAPRLWRRKKDPVEPHDAEVSCRGLHSVALANLHFWLGMIGILLYVGAMWVSGITQGIMLNAVNGTTLAYPEFIETLNAIRAPMLFRLIGGVFYLAGYVLLAYNIFRTIRAGEPTTGTIEVEIDESREPGFLKAFINAPVAYSTGIIVFGSFWLFGGGGWLILGMIGSILTVLGAVAHFEISGARWVEWYDKLLKNWAGFTILTFISVAIGGAIQIIPTITVERASNIEGRIQIPYTPLELAGRDIFISEGCYNCHSQMIRTMVPDVLRYGSRQDQGYSRLGESIYDFPFQWGSKRTGPDLAREGGAIKDGYTYMRIGKRDNVWQYGHLMNPRDLSPGSTMPNYPFLADQKIDIPSLADRIAVQRDWLGVPYPVEMDEEIVRSLAEKQALEIANDLKERQFYVDPDSKMVALISYLQKLGAYEETARTAKND